MTVQEALDAMRDLYGYEYRIQGTRIFDPAEHGCRRAIFQVNYLAGKRQGTTDMRVTSGSITDANANGANAGASNATTTQPGAVQTATGPPSSRIATETQQRLLGRAARHADVDRRQRRRPAG